jgi:hypothetical protein
MIGIGLIIAAWYATGWILAWRTMLAIDPKITRGDVVVISLMGIIGPFGLIHYLVHGIPTHDKVVTWLSGPLKRK